MKEVRLMNAVPADILQAMSLNLGMQEENKTEDASIFASMLEKWTTSEMEQVKLPDASLVDQLEEGDTELSDNDELANTFSLESLMAFITEHNLIPEVMETILDHKETLVTNNDPELWQSVMNNLHHLMMETGESENGIFHILENISEVSNTTPLDHAVVTNFRQFLVDIQDAMQHLQQGQRTEEAASKWLPLIKKWSSFSDKVDNATLKQVAAKKLPTETLDLIEKLTDLYERRHHFSSKKIYGQDATVTTKDVARWLSQSVKEKEQPAEEHTNRVISPSTYGQMTSLKMSTLEQHVIHVNRGERIERVGQQLTQQISSILQQSTFLQQKSPLQEISIMLRPEHLGAISIKFTQVNNEMMVKIITSSSMTKDLLEGNIQQLKHVFSPHQVQVVRDDTIIDDEIIVSTEEDEDDDHKDEHADEEDRTDKQDTNPDMDFATYLQQIEEEEVVAHE